MTNQSAREQSEGKNLIFDVGNCLPILRKHALEFFFSCIYEMFANCVGLRTSKTDNWWDKQKKSIKVADKTQTSYRRDELICQGNEQNDEDGKTYLRRAHTKVECEKLSIHFLILMLSLQQISWLTSWRVMMKTKKKTVEKSCSRFCFIIFICHCYPLSPLLGKTVYLSAPQ